MDMLVDTATVFLDVGPDRTVPNTEEFNKMLKEFEIVKYLGATHQPDCQPVRLTFLVERRVEAA